MAAFVPPGNAASISLPAAPQNPPVADDIALAMDYVDDLNDTRRGRLYPTPATDQEVGLAEAYKAGLTFAVGPLPGAAPAAPVWLQAFQENTNRQFDIVNQQLNNIANELVAMRGEQPILLANSAAGPEGRLYNPNMPGQWVQLLTPSSRDELLTYNHAQCMAAANALNLVQPGPQAKLADCRRQIAMKIGVKI